jgi:hypothetical protein
VGRWLLDRNDSVARSRQLDPPRSEDHLRSARSRALVIDVIQHPDAAGELAQCQHQILPAHGDFASSQISGHHQAGAVQRRYGEGVPTGLPVSGSKMYAPHVEKAAPRLHEVDGFAIRRPPSLSAQSFSMSAKPCMQRLSINESHLKDPSQPGTLTSLRGGSDCDCGMRENERGRPLSIMAIAFRAHIFPER